MNQRQRQRALARGLEGEAFVVRVLQSWGWCVLHQRWHCRWGELDIVAQEPGQIDTLVFVEVKARSAGAWDPRLAVTPVKQQRLWRAAEQFLGAHEALAAWPCRFDVALVSCPTARGGYQLQQYIKGAFEG